MTDDQQRLANQLVAVLGEDPRIRSVWLSGSLGRGAGDAWSDVDLTIVVAENAIAACVADYGARTTGLPSLVLSQIIHGRVLTAITKDWRRFDLAFLTPGEFARQDGAGLRHLLGDAEKPPERPRRAGSSPAQLNALVTEFLRVMGLAPVAFGREEWLVARQGVELLRQMTVDLMVEEAGLAPSARGVKRLNPFLTEDQRLALEALPSPPADPLSLLEAQVAISALFLPRARKLLAERGIDWPVAFEGATRDHLRTTLGVELP
ncbi:nucleotidyltransferase domain-containing protein [Phenylobacterium koreense]|uniref:Nucleotidyltransferase n=1 Tax=Phenylobacterium koreense TaxID=266125 RepID=A0ABV2EJ77_9CAUL